MRNKNDDACLIAMLFLATSTFGQAASAELQSATHLIDIKQQQDLIHTPTTTGKSEAGSSSCCSETVRQAGALQGHRTPSISERSKLG